MGKMMMLVAAKWREFSSQNPLTEQNESDQNEEQDYTPKPSRSRATKVLIVPFGINFLTCFTIEFL